MQKFSLWNNKTDFIQSSNELSKLRTNVSQVKAWHDTMGNESGLLKLTIRDNVEDRVILTADYRVGAALRWKSVS